MKKKSPLIELSFNVKKEIIEFLIYLDTLGMIFCGFAFIPCVITAEFHKIYWPFIVLIILWLILWIPTNIKAIKGKKNPLYYYWKNVFK